MIQLTFLGDKWIFLALSLIVLILLGMVFKYVFKPGPIGAVADATGKPANFNPSNNNHFLNSKRGNMHKISKIFVEKEGKHYVLIDMGNDMVLIMEEDFYEPEQRDASMMRNIENSANNVMDIEVNDAEEVGYLPEKKDEDKASQIISDSDDEIDVDNMLKIHENNEKEYFLNQQQKTLFETMKDEPEDDEDVDSDLE